MKTEEEIREALKQTIDRISSYNNAIPQGKEVAIRNCMLSALNKGMYNALKWALDEDIEMSEVLSKNSSVVN